MRKRSVHGRNVIVAIALATIVLSLTTRYSAIRAYQSPGKAVATISAATFKAQVATDSVAASFGQGLITGTVVASTIPLPTTLLGTTVAVRDALGVSRLAPLLFVSPSQNNHLIPIGTASGTVTVQSGNGQTSTGTVQVAQVAPGIFTANQSGEGAPALRPPNNWTQVGAGLVPARHRGSGARARASLAPTVNDQALANPLWSDLGAGGVVNVTLNLVTPSPVNGSGVWTALPFFIDGVDPAFNPTSTQVLDASPTRTRMQQVQLSDGRLITTGVRKSNPQGSSYAIISPAEIFDPATDKWTRIANMIFPREDYSLTVLGNGLYDNRYASEPIVIGGRGLKNIEDSSVLASRTAEIYDLSTNTWRRLADLEFPHIEHTVTRLNDGRLLVVGGMDELGQVNAAVELYDPNDDRWTTVASPAAARAGHRAIIGGSNDSGEVTTIEIFDPQTNSWSSGGTLNFGRAGLTATRLAAAGVSAEIYDRRTHKSTLTGDLNTSRHSHISTLLADGSVLVNGGFDDGRKMLTGCEIINPSTNQWTVAEALTEPRASHNVATPPEGRIMVVGGVGHNRLETAREFHQALPRHRMTWQ